MSIDSEIGRGTTITILIPVTDKQLPSAPPAQKAVLSAKESATVLVVEDYDDLRDLIEEILRSAGYQVLTARDGAAGLTLSREHPGEIDALLTDIVMPNMLGPDLAEQMKAEHPGLRVLFMSGHAQPVLGTAAMLSPDSPLLQKPFMAPDLLDKLREVLGASG